MESPPIGRRKSRPLCVGGVQVGGDAPVRVQSMCTTDTRDVRATVEQVRRMEEAGCEITRVAVPDMEAARAVREIRREIRIPLVADIHFDWRLAIAAAEAGADCLRINPGNINGEARVSEVVACAKDRGLPIRVGVNSGSVEKHLLTKYDGATAEAMVESALAHLAMLEKRGFYDTKVSLKASDVFRTVAAYRLLAGRVDYPLHLGITEAGTLRSGSIKSAVGLGILLHEGIGDTIRVSLAADPAEEVRVAFDILKALRLRQRGVNVVACPSCGRVQIDVDKLASELERDLAHLEAPLTVAVMGCEVNGPGEARDADVGVAAGHRSGLIFVRGQKVGLVPYEEIKSAILKRVEEMAAEPSPQPPPAKGA